MLEQTPINVTRPSVPPLEKFHACLEELWRSRHLTNNGKYHQLLEQELCARLGVSYGSLFCNGTLALEIALQAMGVQGEVITTPFTFIATTTAIVRAGCVPVFCDIEEGAYGLDPDKVEAAITPRTGAILAVHVYGRPCAHARLQEIADRHHIKLIYDAAHAFGVLVEGRSVMDWGDASMVSFHATKIFNTVEGGVLFFKNKGLKEKADALRCFGMQDDGSLCGIGTNAKMNELQAAYGLLELGEVDKYIRARKKIDDIYRLALENVDGISLMSIPQGVRHNYCYFPVRISAKKFGAGRDEVFQGLRDRGINTRKYFFPLVPEMYDFGVPGDTASEMFPVAYALSREVLCLPLASDLTEVEVARVVTALLSVQA